MKAIAVIVIYIVTGFSAAAQSSGGITIYFKHVAGTKELKLFDERYTNPFGEPFVINKFKYYISQLSLTDNSGKQADFPGHYWLVNEEDSLSKEIHLPFATSLSEISFVIGVDSIKNVSGVQTGSLDPANGMFWTWNSGYVFAKLEGQSDSSPAPAHSFSWDVGGFRQPENALRKIKLKLTKTAGAEKNSITITADVLKWFDGQSAVRITQTPVCHQPGRLAGQLADNYSTMFSVAP
jgi:hypothetical protein